MAQNAAREMANDSDEKSEEAFGAASPSMPISIAQVSVSVTAAPVVATADSASAADAPMKASTSSQIVEQTRRVAEEIKI